MIDDLMKGLLIGTQMPLLAYNDMIINLGTCAIYTYDK